MVCCARDPAKNKKRMVDAHFMALDDLPRLHFFGRPLICGKDCRFVFLLYVSVAFRIYLVRSKHEIFSRMDSSTHVPLMAYVFKATFEWERRRRGFHEIPTDTLPFDHGSVPLNSSLVCLQAFVSMQGKLEIPGYQRILDSGIHKDPSRERAWIDTFQRERFRNDAWDWLFHFLVPFRTCTYVAYSIPCDSDSWRILQRDGFHSPPIQRDADPGDAAHVIGPEGTSSGRFDHVTMTLPTLRRRIGNAGRPEETNLDEPNAWKTREDANRRETRRVAVGTLLLRQGILLSARKAKVFHRVGFSSCHHCRPREPRASSSDERFVSMSTSGGFFGHGEGKEAGKLHDCTSSMMQYRLRLLEFVRERTNLVILDDRTRLTNLPNAVFDEGEATAVHRSRFSPRLHGS